MHKLTVAVIAGLLALAAVLGTVAATHTVSLGTSQQQSDVSTIQARTKQLDAFEASLRKTLQRKPPKLPAVPRVPAVSAAPGAPAPAAAGQSLASAPAAANQAPVQKVIYRRPPPVVVIKHASHGDDAGESGHGESQAAGTYKSESGDD